MQPPVIAGSVTSSSFEQRLQIGRIKVHWKFVHRIHLAAEPCLIQDVATDEGVELDIRVSAGDRGDARSLSKLLGGFDEAAANAPLLLIINVSPTFSIASALIEAATSFQESMPRLRPPPRKARAALET